MPLENDSRVVAKVNTLPYALDCRNRYSKWWFSELFDTASFMKLAKHGNPITRHRYYG